MLPFVNDYNLHETAYSQKQEKVADPFDFPLPHPCARFPFALVSFKNHYSEFSYVDS